MEVLLDSLSFLTTHQIVCGLQDPHGVMNIFCVSQDQLRAAE